MHYYRLILETGDALDEDGAFVAWATCPDLPGAYEEAGDAATALERLRELARRIIAEHVVREDPLDPAIAVSITAPAIDAATMLLVAVSDDDLAAAREAPLLVFEAPEP
ncbi:MAG TPA: hypothetical protein VIL85_06510 [Thermomicrobiales bacterium]|jgi:predicted RNase H-like HicB family nuclease